MIVCHRRHPQNGFHASLWFSGVDPVSAQDKITMHGGSGMVTNFLAPAKSMKALVLDKTLQLHCCSDITAPTTECSGTSRTPPVSQHFEPVPQRPKSDKVPSLCIAVQHTWKNQDKLCVGVLQAPPLMCCC